jgi:two-component system nitrogen regulation response regulator NtrX
MAKILVVDDEASIRRTLRDVLEYEKYAIDEAIDGYDALTKVKEQKYDAIILDIKMPKMDGMEVLERILLLVPDTPVIMVSGHANIDTAVEAVKKGAFDFIAKPLDLNRLFITIRNALDRSNLVIETKTLRRKVDSYKTQEIVGESEPIRQLKSMLDTVAPTDSRVLILGPNGTGKELVARWVHEKSNRAKAPFVEVNCAAIPSELIESELFGHIKGSFTGAIKDHAGKFEQANGGTLFLDEIGDMSLSAQAKVLRALQENKITRVGSDKDIRVDVRVLAATNKDLRAEIEKGLFREDLYYRLAVIIMSVPPLNDRRDDIPELVEHFIAGFCAEFNFPRKNITEDAVRLLQQSDWRGNIRELRNVVERLMILGGKEVTAEDVRRFVMVHSRNPAKPKLQELFDRFDSLEEIQHFVEGEYLKYKNHLVS